MDVNCNKCGEPWDRYGVLHGDMYDWQKDLFIAGAGCPCCEGEAPEEKCVDDMVILRSRIGGEFEMACSIIGDPVPQWERPADKLTCECEVCGVKLMKDASTGDLYLLDCTSTTNYADVDLLEWSREWSRHAGLEDVCPDCQVHCDDCEVELIEGADIYDGGILFAQDDYYYRIHPLCVDCYCSKLDEDDDND